MWLPRLQDWLFFIEVALLGKVAKLDGLYVRYRKKGHGISSRTYELLDQSLGMLDLLLLKYPGRVELIKSCKIGKARYLAGEVYRQLMRDPCIARDLARQAVEIDQTKMSYHLLLVASRILCRFEALVPVVAPALKRAKYIVKRFFA